MLRRILHGLSYREYRACAEAVPEAFGLSDPEGRQFGILGQPRVNILKLNQDLDRVN